MFLKIFQLRNKQQTGSWFIFDKHCQVLKFDQRFFSIRFHKMRDNTDATSRSFFTADVLTESKFIVYQGCLVWTV